jgi:hypothetical protein
LNRKQLGSAGFSSRTAFALKLTQFHQLFGFLEGLSVTLNLLRTDKTATESSASFLRLPSNRVRSVLIKRAGHKTLRYLWLGKQPFAITAQSTSKTADPSS